MKYVQMPEAIQVPSTYARTHSLHYNGTLTSAIIIFNWYVDSYYYCHLSVDQILNFQT